MKTNGRDKVIDHRTVWTHDGDFHFTGKKLRCGNTYQAYSYSHKDGWDKSDKLRVRCHKGGNRKD